MSKEHAYAYEAGYRDGAINYELEHCPACKNVADLQEALDENAQLRELVRDYHRFADAMCSERDCDGCSQRDEGACERGVLTSRECVLGVTE